MVVEYVIDHISIQLTDGVPYCQAPRKIGDGVPYYLRRSGMRLSLEMD